MTENTISSFFSELVDKDKDEELLEMILQKQNNDQILNEQLEDNK